LHTYVFTLGKNESKIPKENLRYTIGDLEKKVEDSLRGFNNNALDINRDKGIIDGVQFLFMVVNRSEFLAAMFYFSKSEARILKSGDNIYYVGKWGKIPAALVKQLDQGIAGPSSSQQITISSINLFKNLKVIIALGVCGTFGRLGDVIVSSRIDGCDRQKIKGDQIICRGLNFQPGKTIRQFLDPDAAIWSFKCTKPGVEEHKAKAEFKPMLSGCHLIASRENREKLKNVSQEAGGLEMEGIGVVYGIDIAGKNGQIEFVIVKAGCDFADESKKKEWQPVAAMAAAEFVYERLNKEIVYQHYNKG